MTIIRMTYTAEQYRAMMDSYADLDWGPGSHGARVLAALRIAVLITEPSVIEGALASYSGSVTHENDIGRAAAIRKAVGAE